MQLLKKMWIRCRPSDSPLPTTTIISNEEMKNIIKIVKSLEESGLLI